MSETRTYIDANLLIAAWQGNGLIGIKAMEVLDDPNRTLLVSDAVWLEVMPKAIFHRQELEQDFYKTVFDKAEHLHWRVDILNQAHQVAQQFGVAAMDAIHVASAQAMQADEFISAEKSTKPMFRVSGITMSSLREPVG